MRRLNRGRGNGELSTQKIKWTGLGKPLTSDDEGWGTVEN